jgi:hypothetical protein
MTCIATHATTDEQTKNHQMDHQKSSDGCMYEIKGKKYILNNLKKYTNIVSQE